MTIDEKLQHFYDVSVEEAKADAEKAIQEHKEHLDQMLEEHKAMGRQNAEDEVKAEADNVRREVNKVLSSEQIQLRKTLSGKQEELKEALFEDIKKKAAAFKATPDYEEYLSRRIAAAKDFAGDDEIEVFLSPEDKNLSEKLAKKTGVPLKISEESFVGGIRAAIPEKNILIDNSFAENLESMRKEFKFDGGLSHE